jgi:hypothetical protein
MLFFILLFFHRSYILINILKRGHAKKDIGMNNIVKRITTGLLGLAIAGIVIIGCEKSNGPAPYPCDHTYNQLVLLSKADQGSVPLGPAIPLDSLKNLIIADVGILAVVNMPEYQNGIPMEAIGKIVFAP